MFGNSKAATFYSYTLLPPLPRYLKPGETLNNSLF